MLSWRRDKKEESTREAVPSSANSTPPATNTNLNTANAARSPGRPRLGELLVHEGVITQLQLNEALQKQQETGAFLGQTLVELGYLNQSTLVSFLVKQCKIPHISLLDYNVGEDLFKLVPKSMCRDYRLLPIDKLGKILTVAMVDPLDADALEKVRELCPDLKIKPILCTWNHFEQVSHKLFSDKPDDAEVTMGTFGLSAKKAVSTEKSAAPSDEKSQASKAVAELVQEVAPVKAGAQSMPAHPPSPGAAGAAAQRPPVPQSPPQPAAHMATPEALFDRMGDRVRHALTEALTPLIAEQQKLIALQLESAKGKPSELAREISASMRTSLLEALAPLVEAQGKHQAHAAPFDTVALAKELGESVRAAMMDAVLPVLQAGEMQGKASKTAVEPAFDSKAFAERLAQQMDRSMAAFAKEMREAIAANAPHVQVDKIARAIESSNASQSARVAELTDATKQALLAVREALDSMRAQERPAAGPEATNVSPFPGLRVADGAHGNAALPHFDPMEEIGLGIEADDRVREALLTGRLQRAFTFESYLSGEANAFTLSVARAVSEKFSRELTPFYVYGDVGVGKTHLLQAIGNAITARDPDIRVGYMPGLRFVSACERAARDQELEKFRESFAHWDVLLFDDVQSVAAHKQAQDELRAVLGVLTTEGRLVVVSADCAPDRLTETSHQLVSRLSAGIVARLQAPDMPTRVAILQRHARVLKAKVPDDVLSLIASRVPADVRKLTGALRKALAYAQVAGTEITHELTEEILSHLTTIEAA